VTLCKRHPAPAQVTLCYRKPGPVVDRVVDRESVGLCAFRAFRDASAAIGAGSAPGAVPRASRNAQVTGSNPVGGSTRPTSVIEVDLGFFMPPSPIGRGQDQLLAGPWTESWTDVDLLGTARPLP
jgi:hypothetical protein